MKKWFVGERYGHAGREREREGTSVVGLVDKYKEEMEEAMDHI